MPGNIAMMNSAKTRRTFLRCSGFALVASLSADSVCAKTRLSKFEKSRFAADVMTLHRSLKQIAEQPGSITSPSAVDIWFNHCNIVQETVSRRGRDFHSSFANRFNMLSKSDFVLTFSPEATAIKIHGQPWMGLSSFNPELTLNNAEIYAITPNVRFIDNNLHLYNQSSMKFAPIPDSDRLPPLEVHQAAFNTLLISGKLNPSGFDLHYVRYYILPLGGSTPRPIIAYGYSERGTDALKLELSFVT